MPERRIQTTSQSTIETTGRATTRTRSRSGREAMARPSGLLDGHDMVVTTFHLLSDGLPGAPLSARHASSPAIEGRHADATRSRS